MGRLVISQMCLNELKSLFCHDLGFMLNWNTYPDNPSADGTLSSLSTRREARLNDKVGQGEERESQKLMNKLKYI